MEAKRALKNPWLKEEAPHLVDRMRVHRAWLLFELRGDLEQPGKAIDQPNTLGEGLQNLGVVVDSFLFCGAYGEGAATALLKAQFLVERGREVDAEYWLDLAQNKAAIVQDDCLLGRTKWLWVDAVERWNEKQPAEVRSDWERQNDWERKSVEHINGARELLDKAGAPDAALCVPRHGKLPTAPALPLSSLWYLRGPAG